MKKKQLCEVAALIEAHLKRFARDPDLRRAPAYRDAGGHWTKGRALLKPRAELGDNGNWVTIYYAPFRDAGRRLTPARAREYLEWLDAGNIGPHWQFDIETGGCSEPRGKPRGFISTLSSEQKALAMAYTGDDHVGPPRA